MALRHCLTLLLSLPLLAWGAADEALGIEFANTGVGPDGPWTYWEVSTDFPGQTVAVFPSLLETPVIVNATTCQDQSAQCPLPTLGMWSGSGAHNLFNDQNSAELDPSRLETRNGGYVTELMGLQGSFRYTAERFTYNTTDGTKYLDSTATIIADNISVTYPNGNFYTLGIGYMSLYGGRTFTYDLPNETDWTLNGQLYNGYNESAYPSLSYGLHIGSPTHKINGRLFLGGYDRARVIDDPITVQSNSTFSLADITLGTASGASALLDNPSNAASITGLLQLNTSANLPLSAQPDPGLPYLYLPAATCTAIARHLPLTYDAGLGLYLWNTTSPAYTPLLTSPHHLSFHFHTSGTTGATQPIAVPLALLNLTLEWPLVSTATQYFPCRPHDAAAAETTSSPSVVLGRAFLQAAHLAQNWATGAVWLAQAPGPDYLDGDKRSIDADATTLSKLPNAGTWNETWAAVLTPLDGSSAEGSVADGEATATTTTAGDGSGTGGAGSGLSTGAKAGVGVGAAIGGIALIALVVGAVVWRRRRRREAEVAEMPNGGVGVQQQRMEPQELEAGERQELPASSHGGGVKELPGE